MSATAELLDPAEVLPGWETEDLLLVNHELLSLAALIAVVRLARQEGRRVRRETADELARSAGQLPDLIHALAGLDPDDGRPVTTHTQGALP